MLDTRAETPEGLPSSAPSSPPLPWPGPSLFTRRHIGPNPAETAEMLKKLGFSSLAELSDAAVPSAIRLKNPLKLPPALPEHEVLARLRGIFSKNKIFRSYIGTGYSGTITPPVILRNVLENPGWYTSYTPYQAEIAQGRLEALLNFQTMISDLTAMEISNASLLDEGTAAAEAMSMAFDLRKNLEANSFFVAAECHPQTVDVLVTRAQPLGIKVVAGAADSFKPETSFFGAVLQYPSSTGAIPDYEEWIQQAHAQNLFVIVAADLLSLTLLRPPGEFGADAVVGNSQRFGVPFGFGGPHAAFLATRDAFKRSMPGRLIGISQDSAGKPALRLSLQTREQHIRRDKATSNICTAQALLANMASLYAVYHGPEGLKAIARRIHGLTCALAGGLAQLGFKLRHDTFFDTVTVELEPSDLEKVIRRALERRINLRHVDKSALGISLDETVSEEDILDLLSCFSETSAAKVPDLARFAASFDGAMPFSSLRKSAFLTHPVFNRFHTETELLRYLHRLQARDLSLTTSMIPLGSCTMKLNATSEMIPLSWPEVADIHPFAPGDQTEGYRAMLRQLEDWLGEITGLPHVSLQPNAGSQGEYAGLLAIHRYHEEHGQNQRRDCLIPLSAHGTNPASAVMAGMKVIPVACDNQGNVDLGDLRKKAESHKDTLAALMVTYPSTHGVFEETILEIAKIVHENGGLLYMDGANMNAQVGLCRPGDFGVDVCHLNLHKTFCIPHGGGGPGVGPIAVAPHLAPYLPGHRLVANGASQDGPVCAAPWGSASITTISWVYIAMLGAPGLTQATQVAILSANYIARRLESCYPVLYKGLNNLVAHECILDFRPFKAHGVEVEDVAKRLMDYGFHAPTMSWPVPGTLMVEPTESESKEELDRFCDAMISIHREIQAVVSGQADNKNNVLKNAPHTAQAVISDSWDRPYSRELAAYPLPWLREFKYWPPVGRVDNVHGDRNLICSCLPMESYAS